MERFDSSRLSKKESRDLEMATTSGSSKMNDEHECTRIEVSSTNERKSGRKRFSLSSLREPNYIRLLHLGLSRAYAIAYLPVSIAFGYFVGFVQSENSSSTHGVVVLLLLFLVLYVLYTSYHTPSCARTRNSLEH